MKYVVTLVTSVLIALFVSTAAAQPDRNIENLYAAVNAMETAPLAKDSKSMREKALRWVIETDKVSITACGGSMSPFLDKKNKYGSELMVTYTIAMAAYKLRNPDVEGDSAVQLAGVESALKAYEAILAEKPNARFEAIDALILLRESDELQEHLKEAGCGD